MARTVVGNVYRSKRWAERWARGRPVRRVRGGWTIGKGRKHKKHRSRRVSIRRRRRHRPGELKRRVGDGSIGGFVQL